MIVSLLYHDVIESADFSSSGMGGAGAAKYKLDIARFKAQLEMLRLLRVDASVPVERALSTDTALVLLTFDDGGASAYAPIAGLLEANGWVGHFFVIGDRIGSPRFLTAHEIRDLHNRGHLIGAHSWSHPPQFARLPFTRLLDEWRRSCDSLAQILGAPVTVGSVPGGSYSRHVAQAAEQSGIRILMTSEPELRADRVGDCLVLGRFGVFRETSDATVANLVRGRRAARQRQWIAWNGRKFVKSVAGAPYEAIRERLLRRKYGGGA